MIRTKRVKRRVAGYFRMTCVKYRRDSAGKLHCMQKAKRRVPGHFKMVRVLRK